MHPGMLCALLSGCLNMCLQRNNFLDIIVKSFCTFLTIGSFQRVYGCCALCVVTLASAAVVVAVLLAVVVVVVVADVDVVDPLVVASTQKRLLDPILHCWICRAGMDSRGTDGVGKFFFNLCYMRSSSQFFKYCIQALAAECCVLRI